MGRCDYCGKEIAMPYKCRHCGKYFCAEHRLPENHRCSGKYQTKNVFKSGFKDRDIKNTKRKQYKPRRQPHYKNTKKNSKTTNRNITKKFQSKILSTLTIIFIGVVILLVTNPSTFENTDIIPDSCISLSEVSNYLGLDNIFKSPNIGEIEQLIFKYTNDERRINGKNPLKMDNKLTVIARTHSEDMAKNNYFSHINLNGDDPTERAEKSKYPTKKDSYYGYYMVGIGENIGEMPTGNVVGVGYVSNTADDIAKRCVEMWMDSFGHRENILESDYTNIGVGVAYDGEYYICTQDFW